MATCPKCYGYLGDDHHCPRRPLARRAATRAALALLGAVVGLAIGANVGMPYDFFAAVVGGLIGLRIVPSQSRK